MICIYGGEWRKQKWRVFSKGFILNLYCYKGNYDFIFIDSVLITCWLQLFAYNLEVQSLGPVKEEAWIGSFWSAAPGLAGVYSKSARFSSFLTNTCWSIWGWYSSFCSMYSSTDCVTRPEMPMHGSGLLSLSPYTNKVYYWRLYWTLLRISVDDITPTRDVSSPTRIGAFLGKF